MFGALGKGELAAPTRERIALAVAEINGCSYCLSAHTYLGKNLAKLDDAEMTANRNGASNDPKADAAVRFAAKVARERGHVSEDDIRSIKMAGYSDGEIIEIVPTRRPQCIDELFERGPQNRCRFSGHHQPPLVRVGIGDTEGRIGFTNR